VQPDIAKIMGWSNLHCPIAKPVLAAILLVCIGCPALGQTPSPLQEWQYPGGIILQKEFEPEIPEWRVFLGAAGTVRPIYDGALPYRVQPGPVIDIRYRDIAFASVGEDSASTCCVARTIAPELHLDMI
jgi:hypothetical protein